MEKHWLDYVTAIGSIATPIMVLALTALGWRMRHRLDRRLALEDKLRADRIDTYNQILEPFIILLMSDAAWETDKQNRGRNKNDVAGAKLLSLDYRKQAFKLSLVGSDAVVAAYNNLMQYFYAQGNAASPSSGDPREMMALLGTFLLEIRRSMGNEATKLTNWQMLEWFLTDARTWRDA